MKKRILVMVLSVSMIAAMLTGCGSSSKTETSNTVSVEEEDTKDYTDKEEPQSEEEEETEVETEVETEEEAPVVNDDKTIIIEGNQIIFGETTVEEILAMFPDKEYTPVREELSKEISQVYSYVFELNDEKNSICIFCYDFDAYNERIKNQYHKDEIELNGNIPEDDFSNFKVKSVKFIDMERTGEIKDSCIMKGITIGMTVNDIKIKFPELVETQNTAVIRYEFNDYDKKMIYIVYLDIDTGIVYEIDMGCM